MIKTANWKELKSMVAIVTFGAVAIACLCTDTDGLLIGLLLSGIAGIGGYELAKRKRVEE